MTTPEMKPLLPRQKDGIMYGFGTKGFSDPEGYSWEIRPVGTRKVSEAEIQVVLEKLHDYIKSLTRPTPTPSSEYEKAVDILETVKRCAALDQEDRMIIFSPESELMSEIDLALSALKSHPTPAKEQSGELEKAVEDAHEWRQFNIWQACKKCGVIQRADGKNGPCKGITKISLRGLPPIEPTEDPFFGQGFCRICLQPDKTLSQGICGACSNNEDAVRIYFDCCGLESQLEQALTTLKSHPTPAKEPSGELEKAVEVLFKAAEAEVEADLCRRNKIDAKDFIQKYGADAVTIQQRSMEYLEYAVKAYRAQVTKEGRDEKAN